MTGDGIGPEDERREQITVAADYHQYYIHDGQDVPDWGRLEHTTDGVIAPLGTGAVIQTGARAADLHVEVALCSGPVPRPEPDVVAAECDLEVPSGIVAITSWSGEARPFWHEFGHPTQLRLRVEVSGRDLFSTDGASERHTLLMWESTDSEPRWRSEATDFAAERLS